MNPLFRIKKRDSVHDNAPLVGTHNSGDALERHAFTAPGCPQQSQNPILRLKIHIQHKTAEIFFNGYLNRHHVFPLPIRLKFRRAIVSSAVRNDSPID